MLKFALTHVMENLDIERQNASSTGSESFSGSGSGTASGSGSGTESGLSMPQAHLTNAISTKYYLVIRADDPDE